MSICDYDVRLISIPDQVKEIEKNIYTATRNHYSIKNITFFIINELVNNRENKITENTVSKLLFRDLNIKQNIDNDILFLIRNLISELYNYLKKYIDSMSFDGFIGDKIVFKKYSLFIE